MAIDHNWPMVEKPGGNYFGKWLVARRTALGMSGNRLALTADIVQTNLSKVERGERNVTDDMLTKLAPVLGIPLDELKREALRDRLTPDELQAAAEIAAETALPPDTPPDQAAERFAEQGAEWFTFNSRAAKPEDEDKFWEAWMAVAEAKLRQRREQREKGTQ